MDIICVILGLILILGMRVINNDLTDKVYEYFKNKKEPNISNNYQIVSIKDIEMYVESKLNYIKSRACNVTLRSLDKYENKYIYKTIKDPYIAKELKEGEVIKIQEVIYSVGKGKYIRDIKNASDLDYVLLSRTDTELINTYENTNKTNIKTIKDISYILINTALEAFLIGAFFLMMEIIAIVGAEYTVSDVLSLIPFYMPLSIIICIPMIIFSQFYLIDIVYKKSKDKKQNYIYNNYKIVSIEDVYMSVYAIFKTRRERFAYEALLRSLSKYGKSYRYKTINFIDNEFDFNEGDVIKIQEVVYLTDENEYLRTIKNATYMDYQLLKETDINLINDYKNSYTKEIKNIKDTSYSLTKNLVDLLSFSPILIGCIVLMFMI